MIMNEEQQKAKEAIWTEANKDYLEDQRIKQEKAEQEASMGVVKTEPKRVCHAQVAAWMEWNHWYGPTAQMLLFIDLQPAPAPPTKA